MEFFGGGWIGRVIYCGDGEEDREVIVGFNSTWLLILVGVFFVVSGN